MDAPQTLGKYEIRGTLGRGAMGVVLDGWDAQIARRVAIKTVPMPEIPDEDTAENIARFRREAQAAGRLTHPNIVGVYDYGEIKDLAYIVMEFVDGPTLKSLLDKKERFTPDNVLRIMTDVLAALEFSHGRGVIHRDIKPANVMLTGSGQAKLTDFGIARIETSNMTQAGTILGTPAYMSPEQFRGEAADARTDVYSAGVLLYQLLTGDRPFDGSLTAIMHKALNTEPPPPSALAGVVPPALDAVVQKAMAKRPADRFPSAAAFAEALRTAMTAPASAPVTALPPSQGTGSVADILGDGEDEATLLRPAPAAASAAPPPKAAPPQPAARAAARASGNGGSKRPLFAGIGVAALAVIGGAVWFLTGSSEPTPPASTAATAPSSPSPSAQSSSIASGTGPVASAPAASDTAAPKPQTAAPETPPPTQQAAATPVAPPQATPAPAPAPASVVPAPVAPVPVAPVPVAPVPVAPAPAASAPVPSPPVVVQPPPPKPPVASAPASAPAATPTPVASAPPGPAAPPKPAEPPAPAAPAPAASTPGAAPVPAPQPEPAPPAPPVKEAAISPAALLPQIAQAVSGSDCTIATATVRDDSGFGVHGIAAAPAAASLRKRVQDVAGTRPVGWYVAEIDPVFCPAVAVLRPIAEPRGTGAAQRAVAVTLEGDRTVLRDGDPILPRIGMPGFAGELRVDYFTHDGSLAHLYPTVADAAQSIPAQPARRLASGDTLQLGRVNGKAIWEAGPPYGTDMIFAVASSVPLKLSARANAEDNAGPYLAELGQAVEAARAAGARVSGGWLLVRTAPKAP